MSYECDGGINQPWIAKTAETESMGIEGATVCHYPHIGDGED